METADMGLGRPDASVGECGRGEVVVARADRRSSSCSSRSVPVPITELRAIAKHPARHPWAWLQQRVFAVDIMTCPSFRGAMRLVKIANKADDIAPVLADLGRPRPRPAPTGQRASSCWHLATK